MCARTDQETNWSLQFLMFVFLMAVFVFVLPFILPIALVLHLWKTFRARSIAKRSPCPSCGNILGTASLRLAREHSRLARAQYQREHPGMKIKWRKDLRPHTMCVTCGAWSVLDVATKNFVLKEAVAKRPRSSEKLPS
jgi:hypothetical protein